GLTVAQAFQYPSVIACTICCVVTGISRVVLAMHHPLDVLFGWQLGIVVPSIWVLCGCDQWFVEQSATNPSYALSLVVAVAFGMVIAMMKMYHAANAAGHLERIAIWNETNLRAFRALKKESLEKTEEADNVQEERKSSDETVRAKPGFRLRKKKRQAKKKETITDPEEKRQKIEPNLMYTNYLQWGILVGAFLPPPLIVLIGPSFFATAITQASDYAISLSITLGGMVLFGIAIHKIPRAFVASRAVVLALMMMWMILLSQYIVCAILRKPVVALPNGVFEGLDDGTFVSYLGIPYAKPPVGALRFKPPQFPAIDYYGVTKSAKSPGNRCVQTLNRLVMDPLADHAIPESEDCLNLNIYAPKGAANLPVVVWIHGGSFMNGQGYSSLYNGKSLLEADPSFVLVTFNYRVGVFGFLSGQQLSQESSLNAGLLDQAFVFQWVQMFIAKFGGDPTRVTALGQSAGAIAVGIHLAALAGRQQFFQRAIMLSGATPAMVLTPELGEAAFQYLAQKLGCAVGSDQLDCMRSKDARTLNEAVDNSVNLLPVVDGTYLVAEPVVTTQMLKAISKIPILITNVADEGDMYGLLDSAGPILTTEDDNKAKARLLPFPATVQAQILQNYPETNSSEPFRSYGRLFGDILFLCPAWATYSLYSSLGVETYRGLFDHTPTINMYNNDRFQLTDGYDIGVYHGADLPFLWQYKPYLHPSERDFARSYAKTLLSFAKGVQPWEPYKGKQEVYLISNQTVATTNDVFQRCSAYAATIAAFLQSAA
ncbi:hypothetical protein HDU91_004894, partial [Kappamyces sp. JEL0680]